jgi:hypothetical protein
MPKKTKKTTVTKQLTPVTSEHLEKIHELALKQVAPKDIAQAVGLETVQVYDALTEHFPHLKELKLFKDFKSEIYRSLQKKATEFILQKIPIASLKDLTYLVAILEDKINLREGKSTQNIGIGIRIEHLVSQKEKVLEHLRSQGTPEHMLEDKLKETLQLPYNASIPLQEILPARQPDTPSPEQLEAQVLQTRENLPVVP